MFICNDDGTIYETYSQLDSLGMDLRFLCSRVLIGECKEKVKHRNPELFAVYLHWNREDECFMNNELYSCWEDVVSTRLPV